MMVSISHADTYVVDTLGGAALQPVLQQQLNQLPNAGTVMLYQDRLVINTTSANYAKISQLIAQIDRLPQTLSVSVRVGDNHLDYQNNGYAHLGVINHQVYVNGSWHNSQSQTTANQLYQVQTLSGKPASIGLEQILSIPTMMVNGYRTPYPQVWIGNTLLSANQGISVTPTVLANGQIQVALSQSNDKFGRFNQQTVVSGQKLSTTIIVNPNQWTTIGYVSQQSQTSETYGSNSQSGQTPIQIMVL